MQHWHLLYYVITRQKDLSEVLNTRVMKGADYSTDHILVRSKLTFTRRKAKTKTKGDPAYKLNVGKLRN